MVEQIGRSFFKHILTKSEKVGRELAETRNIRAEELSRKREWQRRLDRSESRVEKVFKEVEPQIRDRSDYRENVQVLAAAIQKTVLTEEEVCKVMDMLMMKGMDYPFHAHTIKIQRFGFNKFFRLFMDGATYDEAFDRMMDDKERTLLS